MMPGMDGLVTLTHPDHPGHEVTVSARRARLLARQGWQPAAPSKPTTATGPAKD